MGVCESMCKERYVGDLETFLSRLSRYVNLDTPSGGKEALDAQGEALREEFLAAGAQVVTHERPGGNLLECTIGNGPRKLLLLGHMDTVFPVGTVAKHPYVREGNILRGPGVLDMKSGVLMILEIMRHFADKMPPEFTLVALLNCDEEIGSLQSSPRILELARQSEACLCMEPSKPGYCTVARKGLITFTITTAGVAAHSGVNYHLGHSAIQALCRIIGNLYTLRDDEKSISINVGGISGGTGKGNVVAAEAGLIAEVRFYEPERAKPLLEAIERFAADTGDPQVTSTLTVLAQRPPMQQTDRSRQLYEKARACALRNGLVMEPRTHGGGSDGSFAASAGIPVIDGMGAEGEFSHTLDEYVKADTILQRLQTCIDLIAGLMDE